MKIFRLKRMIIFGVALFFSFGRGGTAFAADCAMVSAGNWVCCSATKAGSCAQGTDHVSASNNYVAAVSAGTLVPITPAQAGTMYAWTGGLAASAAAASPSSTGTSSGTAAATPGAAVNLVSPIKCDDGSGGKVDCTVEGVITGVMNFIFGLALIICPLFIIWGGFNIATAAGAEDKVKNGKDIITYALVGLVIIAISKGLIDAIKGMLN